MRDLKQMREKRICCRSNTQHVSSILVLVIRVRGYVCARAYQMNRGWCYHRRRCGWRPWPRSLRDSRDFGMAIGLWKLSFFHKLFLGIYRLQSQLWVGLGTSPILATYFELCRLLWTIQLLSNLIVLRPPHTLYSKWILLPKQIGPISWIRDLTVWSLPVNYVTADPIRHLSEQFSVTFACHIKRASSICCRCNELS